MKGEQYILIVYLDQQMGVLGINISRHFIDYISKPQKTLKHLDLSSYFIPT